jgi:hypothetical protein
LIRRSLPARVFMPGRIEPHICQYLLKPLLPTPDGGEGIEHSSIQGMGVTITSKAIILGDWVSSYKKTLFTCKIRGM